MLKSPSTSKGSIMMHFFRKYQRYFFIFLTGMIVISFSFFGTYNALASSEVPDPNVFTDVSGKHIKQSTLSNMIRFLATDSDDKIAKGGIWGPNFLNDGVIKKDFLESGLALMVAEPFMKDLKADIDTRKERQQSFKPYVHPYNKSLSAQSSWNFFAPSIPLYLDSMKTNLSDQDFLTTQVALYLEQDRFPPEYLKKIVYYQESEMRNLPNDPYLQSKDFSLFGYHSLEDWFGSNFLQLSAQFIINSAAIAKQQGIKVSDDEALAELLYNNEISYRKLKEAKSPYLLVKNSSDYFKEQLRYLGIDQKTALDIWKQVIAFRKLSNHVSESVFVDSVTYSDYQKWAKETVKAEIFELPEYMKLNDVDDLKQFETYVALVMDKGQDPLVLSNQFKSLEEIKTLAPELLQKRYDVNVAEVLASDIQMKASLKEVWNWQLESGNWPKLLVKFPELGTNYNLSRDEKLVLLDSLMPANRFAIDNFTRSEIVKNHPEWISDALDSAQFKKVSFSIKEKGSDLKKLGLSKPKALQSLLDSYPLNDSSDDPQAKLVKESLYNYTEDGSKYFRIEVIGRENEYAPLTFKDALEDGTLKLLSDKNKTDVSSLVDSIISYANDNGYPWHETTGISKEEFAAQYRFLKYTQDILLQVKASDFTFIENQDSSDLKAAFMQDDKLSPFYTQFKVVKKDSSITRNEYVPYDQEAFYLVKEGQYSNVLVLPKSNAYFFKINAFEVRQDGVAQLMQKAQNELGRQAAVKFMKTELEHMIAKKALNVQRLYQEGLES